MPDMQPWPKGYELLIDNAVTLNLEPIPLPAVPLIDNVGDGTTKTKILRSYRAVGAVAGVRYQSGRVIPKEVQADAIERAIAADRQMTMYIDHPSIGINCGEHETSFGRVEFTAGIACTYRYDDRTGETWLDRIDILDVPEGRKFIELIDAGIKFGLSQRAVGRQEPCKLKLESGEEEHCLLVTDIYAIFGWDFVRLDTANAGRITQLEPLTDNALRSSASPGRVHDCDTQEQDAMSTKVKEAKDKKDAQPINDSSTTPASKAPGAVDGPDKDNKEADQKNALLDAENAKLNDKIQNLCKEIQGTVADFKTLNDDFKGRYMEIEAEENLYNGVYRAARIASSEAYRTCSDESLTSAEKNAKFTELLAQMTECFTKISEAYVNAHMRAEDGGPAEPVEDKAPAAPSADVVPIHDAGNPISYIPPKTKEPAQPAKTEESTRSTTSAADLMDSVDKLIDAQAKRKAMIDLRDYAVDAVTRQKLDAEPHKRVLAIVDKTIHSNTTKEAIEGAIQDAIELVKSGQATERLSSMGLDQPQGAGKMRITDVQNAHSLGAEHLGGVKLLTDSFEFANSQYRMAIPDSQKIPLPLKKILDKFDEQFGAELAREKQILADKLKASGEGKKIFDASGAADFNTPATLSRMVLMEVYAEDITREITDFGTMDNHRDSIPITRWRRDEAGAASTFRPSVLQRNSVRGGELSPMSSGRMTTEFFDIDAQSRKLQATLSLEFLTRSKRRTDISGTAMAIKNLQDEIKRILMMDVFFEQIRAGAMHGATAFSATIDGTGTSLYRAIGTTDANTTTIVPNDARSPLVVSLGTTSANRTAVPEYGTTKVGGGPGGAYFYVIEHSTSKITFVDAAGVAQNTATATGCIQVAGYKADKEKRFDMTLPASTTQEQHMNSLLFACSNQRAALSSGGISDVGYYDPTSIIASVTTSELMKQAAAYQADGRRNAYRADAEVSEGNYGFTAGLAHWGSKIFPDDFIVVGAKDGVAFRVYEPTHLRGPVEAHNSSGQLIGGEEYYAYQEDAIDTPLVEKFTLVSLYRS